MMIAFSYLAGPITVILFFLSLVLCPNSDRSCRGRQSGHRYIDSELLDSQHLSVRDGSLGCLEGLTLFGRSSFVYHWLSDVSG